MRGFFKRRPPAGFTLSLLELPDTSFCAVKGESHYQEALGATRGHCSGVFEGQPAFVAALVPEPENPYDPNAVAVYSPAGKLGYLPRERAPEYREVFDQLTRLGYHGAGCAAHLTGGDGGRSYGVVLRLARASACLEVVVREATGARDAR
jgi:hypothetical protein